MARVLLVLVLAFAALSSSTAEAIGLTGERTALFTALVGLLVLLPFLIQPRLAEPDAGTVILLVLMLAMAALDARGRIDPLDYRMLLPILVILAAPNLARSLGGMDLDRFVWRLLSLYVVATLAYQTLAEPAVVARGYGGITRYDPTGSVVMHASLATIHAAVAAARALDPATSRAHRLRAMALGMCSVALVLSAATRTVLLVGGISGALMVVVSQRPAATAMRVSLGALAAMAVLAVYSLAWDDSFVGRLAGADTEDWGSGRWPSIVHWMALLGDQPWGLGLGAVREMLAPGKPWLDGAQTLEWPHNELFRFFLEAGPVGLAFVLVFLGTLVRRAVRAATTTDAAPRRALVLVIAADLVAEALLQNLFNAVYHLTVLVLILCLASETPDGRQASSGLRAAVAR